MQTVAYVVAPLADKTNSSTLTIQEMMLGMLCCIAGSTTVIVPLILITRPFLRKLRRSKWFSKIGKRMEANLADRAESAYSEEKNEKSLFDTQAKTAPQKPKKSKKIDESEKSLF